MSAPRRPFAFQWHITDQCDQRCKHCYIFSVAPGKVLDSMPLARIPEVIDKCCAFCDRFHRDPYFSLTGGDPILHPDFWSILDLLHQRDLPVTLMGNPFHLTPETCQRLADLGCLRYQMSLDGLEQTHDWFRKLSSFQATLEKLPLLKAAGIETAIMTTVSGINIEQIPDLVDIVAANPVDIYAFARYCPDPSIGDNGITPQAYRQLLDTCWHKFQAYERSGCQTVFNLKDHLWALYQYEEGFFHPENAEDGVIYGGCNCGNCHLTILPNGDLYACRRFSSRVGNVFEDDLADVWLHPMEAYRQFDAFEKCAQCELLAFCRGCPAVACGTTGSFYGADPQCWKAV